MWFKTRVGFIGVAEPSEILFDEGSDGGVKRWYIYVRLKAQQEGKIKGLFGSGTFSNPFSYLAMFSDSPSVRLEIRNCMGLIEASLRTKADVCDLSLSGDAQAWGKAWKRVEWPDRDEPAV